MPHRRDPLDAPARKRVVARPVKHRSQSDGSRMTPPHQAVQSGLGHQDSSSLPSVGEDDDTPTIEPPSPGTPPKKQWERHYRNFLSRKRQTGNPLLDPATVQPTFLKKTASAELGKPKTQKLVTNKSTGESSVRGGKFFANVFRHNDSKPASAPVKRRVKSFSHTDELDGTLRRGTEKAYSPGNMHVRSNVTFDPRVSSTGTLASHLCEPVSAAAATAAAQASSSLLRPRTPENYVVRSQFIQSDSLMDGMPNLPFEIPAKRGDDQVDVSSSAMKKAFTEFHNSSHTGRDAVSAYLGEDQSFRGHSLFWAQNRHISLSSADAAKSLGNSASHNDLRSSPPTLESIQENVEIHRSIRVLKPIQGVDTWQSGRRYLIAPAALAACSLSVMSALSGDNDLKTAPEAIDSVSPFGTIVLGECLLSYAATQGKTMTSTSKHYSSAILVLRQNYLLEYNADADLRGMPRGFAHLQFAECHLHQHFADALELHFYGSPCAKSDKRVLVIRLQRREERESWQTCLNRSANLDIENLYEYSSSRTLGTGSYASVYSARRKSDVDAVGEKTPYNCALKVFDKNLFWKYVVKGRERSDTIVREASVQATLTARCGKIPSFLRIQGLFETSNHVVLELELLEGTDLFKYIQSKQVLPEEESAKIMYEVLQSLHAMKRSGLAHRDIKPANILMCSKTVVTAGGPRVKVCDFGMATFVGVDGLVRGRCGTPGYVAPEIFTAGLHGGYGNKVDVFSAGVTLYVMLCGYEPFYGETDEELIDANKNAMVDFPDEEWSSISDLARDLVQKMTHPDPRFRPDAKEAMKHEWFQLYLNDINLLDRSMTLPPNEIPNDGACILS